VKSVYLRHVSAVICTQRVEMSPFIYEKLKLATNVFIYLASIYLLSVCLCFYLYLRVSIFLLINQLIYLSNSLYLTFYLSICQPIHLSIHLSVILLSSFFFNVFVLDRVRDKEKYQKEPSILHVQV
jgi:hypothetical protein